MLTIPRRLLIAALQLTRYKSFLRGDNSELIRRQQEWANAQREPSPKLAGTANFSRHDFAGFSYYTITPKGSATKGRLFFIHGGAYVFDISRFHWEFLTDLCRRSGFSITVPLYPLAPQHTLPEVFDWTYRLWDHCLAESDQPMTMAGDSAGGGLSLALAMQLRNDGKAQPEQLILISPWLDLRLNTPEMQAISDPILDLAGLLRCGELYLNNNPDDYRSSPLNGDFHSLAPLHVFTGTRDVLHPLARELRNRANEQSIAVNYLVSPGSLHDYPLFPTPDGFAAREQILDLLQTR